MPGQPAPLVNRAGIGQQGLEKVDDPGFPGVAPAVVGQGSGQVEFRGHGTRMRWERATSLPTRPRPLR